MEQEKTLVLVDGSSLAFRSFFALFSSGLRTKTGQPTWAILGFFNSLFELIEKFKPEMLAVTFDMAEPTFRHIEFEDYKANRPEMPDDLSSQWPLIKQGVQALGLPVYELAGYEADDIIGTIARAAEKEKVNVLILTGDQDAFQLIDGHDQKIKVLMPGKNGLQIFGRQEVFNKLGVWPEQITDYKGLCGDTSDNIPGIKGIGPKTAQQLLASHGGIDGIYQHIDQIKAKGVHDKLVEGAEIAHRSKKLATIRHDVPLKFDFTHCHLTPPDIGELNKFFLHLEFKTLVGRLPKILYHFSGTDNIINAVISTSEPISLIKESLPPEENGQNKEIIIPAHYAIICSEIELDSLIETLDKQIEISFYINASPGSPLSANAKLSSEPELFGYAFAWEKEKAYQAAYIPLQQFGLALGGKQGLDRQLVNTKLRKLFLHSKVKINLHNYKHILNLLAGENIKPDNVIIDTMLASYICSPDEKHSLHEQANRLFNYSIEQTSSHSRSGKENKSKKTTKINGTSSPSALVGLNLPQLCETACGEARINLELAQYYNQTMDSDQKSLLQEMELPLSVILAKMEQCGVALDLPYLEQLSRELNTDISRLEKEIYAHAGQLFNINSTQQLQKILFEKLELKTKARTKTGFSTDASVLESLKNDHQIIPLLLDYRQLTKLKSTYVDALPKMVSSIDGRLHGEFNQTATSTGRLSSSNPNLQNIPIRTELGRRMRRAFIPADKGWLLLSADYSQIELRLLAHMSDDDRLIDAFQKNQDIHARTASEIFDQAIETVNTDMRRIGKTLNFALIYQQGAYATARDLGISTKEAGEFIDKYFKRYAGVKTFMEKTIESARQNGYVETLWKRKRYFKFLNDRNEALKRADERAACNAPLQGSAADLMKLAMIRLKHTLLASRLNAKLILQVHDELVLEVPEAEIDQTKQIIIDAMLLDQPLKVPLKVDVGIGHNWMDTK